MLRRRLVPLLLLAVWLAPPAAAGALAAHELAHHDAAPESAALAALEHGHAHEGTEVDHEHPSAIGHGPDSRLTRHELLAPEAPAAAGLESAPSVSAGLARLATAEAAPPPRPAGRPLLAHLSLLRL